MKKVINFVNELIGMLMGYFMSYGITEMLELELSEGVGLVLWFTVMLAFGKLFAAATNDKIMSLITKVEEKFHKNEEKVSVID